MALIGELNATTEYYWAQTEPEDILNKASALLWKLMGNAKANDNWLVKPHETVDGGLMIKVPLEYGAANSGSYGATTVINQAKQTIVDAARFPWSGIYGSQTKNLDDLTQNSGEEAVINLTKIYINAIIKAARTQMATQVIATGTGDAIRGLGNLFNTTTSTEYGSIATDNMSTWTAKVITTDDAISFEVMQKIWREPAMGSFKGMLPNFCCTTTKLRDGYERTLHPQQIYKEASMVEAGWDNITHKGAPIVADPYYDTNLDGYLDALNLNFLSLRSHADYNFTTPVWASKEVLGQPDVMSANTRWRGQLVCSNRRMHVRHNNLSEPA